MEDSFVYTISTSDFSQKDAFALLLKQAKNGETGAFAEIYNRLFKKIYQFIYFRVSHKETAEDLTEDVFLKAYHKLGSVHTGTSFEGWLYQIARNLIIDYYRQKRPQVDLEEIEDSLEYEHNIIDEINLQGRQKLLLGLIKELKKEQQAVIRLKFLEGFGTPEIAALLNKNETAIRVIQHRAISKLRELISQSDILKNL